MGWNPFHHHHHHDHSAEKALAEQKREFKLERAKERKKARRLEIQRIMFQKRRTSSGSLFADEGNEETLG